MAMFKIFDIFARRGFGSFLPAGSTDIHIKRDNWLQNNSKAHYPLTTQRMWDAKPPISTNFEDFRRPGQFLKIAHTQSAS